MASKIKPAKKKPEILLSAGWDTKNIAGAKNGSRPMEFVAQELAAIIEKMPEELDAVVDNARRIIVTIETI